MKLNPLRAIAIATLVLGLISVRVGSAQQPQRPQRGPSTPEERTRAVKIAHDLENDPLAKDAKEQRDWVIQWIIEIPDITVDVCFGLFWQAAEPARGPFHGNYQADGHFDGCLHDRASGQGQGRTGCRAFGAARLDQGLPGDPQAGFRVALGANGQTGRRCASRESSTISSPIPAGSARRRTKSRILTRCTRKRSLLSR